MVLSLIVAVSDNQVIGFKNQIPWRSEMPADMRNFVKLTTGHSVIMGRKTFESIGMPLNKRRNYVITRNPDYKVPQGVEIIHSLDQAIKELAKEDEVFIIGGSCLYEEAIDTNRAQFIYLTRIHNHFEGDTFFYELEPDKWQVLSARHFPADKENKYSYSFELYMRRN
jgi:dihydrofolate reductase